ncbi:FAD-dependent oxidoreductase [Thalassiella azotivora]
MTETLTTTVTTTALDDLPVVVIGAGPVGLAAAAHLRQRGLDVVVLEAGDHPGAAVAQWGHVRTFTPWRWIVDPAAAELLGPTGWSAPAGTTPPTGAEIVRDYLEPLASALGDAVRLGHRVLAVSRQGLDRARTLGRDERPLLVRVAGPRRTEDLLARAVVDASGTWGSPNPLGGSGLPAAGEAEARDAGFVVGPLPDVLGRDRDRHAGRTTLVVGMGHSAANTLAALAELARQEPGTRVLWAVRADSPRRLYGGGAADQLPARGRLGSAVHDLVDTGAVELVTGFTTTAVERHGDTVTVVGTDPAGGSRRLEGVHVVAAATGFRPDLSILSEVRLDLDPGLEAPRALAPLVDPAFHSCGTVPPHGHRDLAHPEPGLYVVGMKSYGRAPTFLVATGNEQVRSVVAAIAGDTRAADEVHLELPETGVCSAPAPATAVDEHHRALPTGAVPIGFATGTAVATGTAGSVAVAEPAACCG